MSLLLIVVGNIWGVKCDVKTDLPQSGHIYIYIYIYIHITIITMQHYLHSMYLYQVGNTVIMQIFKI